MQGRATAAHGDVGDHPRGDNSWQLVTPTSDLWYDVWLHVEAMWRAAIDMPAYKRTHELEFTASGSPSDLLWSRYNRYWLLTFVATSQFPNITDAGSDKHTESLNTNDGLLPNVLLAHFANSELNYLNSIPAVWNKIWNMQFADMNCRSALQWIAQQLETTQIKIDNFASNSPRMSLYVVGGTKPTFKVTMAFDIESLYDLLFYITVSIYWNCSVLCRYAQIKCIISEAYYTYISHKKNKIIKEVGSSSMLRLSEVICVTLKALRLTIKCMLTAFAAAWTSILMCMKQHVTQSWVYITLWREAHQDVAD